MKKLYLFIVLLFCVSGFCQAEKDTLLLRDSEVVKNKLLLMHYLDSKVVHYFATITKEEVKEGRGLAYFYKNLIANSPVTSPTVAEFLGYEDKLPANNSDFYTTVSVKVLDELVALTKIYGYPSQERIPVLIDGKKYMPVVFAARPEKIDNKVKRLFKSEYKIGNISKGEYDTFKYMVGLEHNK